jgi:hypothetical protein
MTLCRYGLPGEVRAVVPDPGTTSIAAASEPLCTVTTLDHRMAWPACVALIAVVVVAVLVSFDGLFGFLILPRVQRFQGTTPIKMYPRPAGRPMDGTR